MATARNVRAGYFLYWVAYHGAILFSGVFRGWPPRFPGFPVFFRGFSGVFQGFPGVFRGFPGVFRGFPRLSRGFPGLPGLSLQGSRGLPGVFLQSGVFPVFSLNFQEVSEAFNVFPWFSVLFLESCLVVLGVQCLEQLLVKSGNQTPVQTLRFYRGFSGVDFSDTTVSAWGGPSSRHELLAIQ